MKNNIYVSSSCVNNSKIADSVVQLADMGFTHIELSGGTNLYDGWLDDLLELKDRYGLSYRCHNYFPPPEKHFVLNLSSANHEERERAVAHAIKAIELSKQLDATEYGIHAGFRFQPDTKLLGKAFNKTSLQPMDEALMVFAQSWNRLESIAKQYAVDLYIENNVLSAANKKTFGKENPFLATDVDSISTLLTLTRAKLLLDVAHLKVSCQSLGLSFQDQLTSLVPLASYLHFSDNNAQADTNHGLKSDSMLYHLLSDVSLQDKTITLEVYDGSLTDSYRNTMSLLSRDN
jgi:sugar phosphate isomerase/epimerase